MDAKKPREDGVEADQRRARRYCGGCGDDLDHPAASIGDSHRCASCLTAHDAIMREIEEHEARISSVPHIRMLSHD